jgi:tetratricopeptide (TPR) repeat protein
MNSLKNQAIQTALQGDWNSAISLNQQILQEEPENIDALNRLAFAHATLGNIDEAKNFYQKVLDLDMQNPIATKNLKRLSSFNGKPPAPAIYKMNNIFIEEPGKTKVIELLNIADQKATSHLHCGEELQLQVKRMKIFVLDNEKQYIGMLPDDTSKRLIDFIQGGNVYEAYVKTVDEHKVTVFVKETVRSPQFKNQQSFINTEKSKLSFQAKGSGDDDDNDDSTRDQGDE